MTILDRTVLYLILALCVGLAGDTSKIEGRSGATFLRLIAILIAFGAGYYFVKASQ